MSKQQGELFAYRSPQQIDHDGFGLKAKPFPFITFVQPSYAVLIVNGKAVVKNVAEADEDWKRTKWLAKPNNLRHVFGTYDTYRCDDCNVELSGYKRGDPNLNKHIFKDSLNGGKCQYIKSKFVSRGKELVVLQGTLRFQHGYMAFPEFMMYAEHKYIPIDDTKYCVFCASSRAQDHYPACSDMVAKIKDALKDMNFDVQLETTRLFGELATRSLWFNPSGHRTNLSWEPIMFRTGTPFAHTVKPTSVEKPSDFAILGEPAGMEHVKGHGDMHTCRRCNLSIRDFVQGDTLLGEHVYHVYNIGRCCTFIEEKFGFNREKVKLTLGRERYRKGQIAFPEDTVDSVNGFSIVHKTNVCVMCGQTAVQGTFLSLTGHKKHCLKMCKQLTAKLQTVKFIE